jgi:nitrate reductase / nitrite oxidoreductase, alpha subunit
MSFYDWYCDLPPASPQVWGEQTDVPESADWYNSTYIIAWGSNVPQTRTPDAHFFTEVRYKGAKTVAVTPDYSEVAKLADIWLHPKQGTDAALAMAMGHVALNEFYFKQRSPYFDDYARRYTDLPLLVMLEGAHAARRQQDAGARPLPARQRLQRQAGPGQQPRVEDRGLRHRGRGAAQRQHRLPLGRVDQGKWNLENKEARHGTEVKLKLS